MLLKIKRIHVPDYHTVAYAEDRESGLQAYIAVHSIHLGPSLGGVRMFPYRTKQAALKDALRLAKAMSFKAAISGLHLGGGKCVIIGDPAKDKSRELFLALGKFIESLCGIYIAAEDSGIQAADLDIVAERTDYLTGTTLSHGSGDPSPATAAGILSPE
jgi:leucine dehydrogenase